MILAWIGALAIGLSLGLLGSGGSILTVPVLLYVLGIDEKPAIAQSLAIVGSIAAVAAVPYARRGLISWRNVVVFGVPGMIGSYLGAAVSAWVSGTFQLVLFAGIMLLAAVMMFRQTPHPEEIRRRRDWKIAIDGLFVGALTGLVGVGGGFLIVPALVLLGGLPMHTAIGSSLTIIALKSAAGFVKYLDVLAQHGFSVDWRMIATMSVVGAVGALAGNRLATRLPRNTLRRAFAVFLVLMGVWILAQKIPDL